MIGVDTTATKLPYSTEDSFRSWVEAECSLQWQMVTLRSTTRTSSYRQMWSSVPLCTYSFLHHAMSCLLEWPTELSVSFWSMWTKTYELWKSSPKIHHPRIMLLIVPLASGIFETMWCKPSSAGRSSRSSEQSNRKSCFIWKREVNEHKDNQVVSDYLRPQTIATLWMLYPRCLPE